jgi:hypothetical protein
MMQAFALERAAVAMRRKDPNVTRFAQWYEQEMQTSLTRFLGTAAPATTATRKGVYRRNPKIKGTMGAFGYDYFTAHYAKHAEIRLDDEYRYEALNLVNGTRTASEIRDALSAIYKPVPLEDVEQYLAALASIDVIIP